ncbi:MAG: chitobiase/beta-hexosaminidase C-terminal domain-containing protein [Lachnospiraceae bacterium]|nr:chitobiase/beta-hexosaminidase C-terminal domain-containing protein [Lachnospiraceae bacterium]
MICPECNNEIPEGKLYCPSCGKAIQIVPDFEPNIEDRLELSKRDIAVVMTQTEEGNAAPLDDSSKTKEIPEVSQNTREIPDRQEAQPSAMDNIAQRQRQRSKRKIGIAFRVVTGLVVAAAVVSVVLAVRFREDDSYDSHMKKAVGFMTAEDYRKAVGEYLLASQKEGLEREDIENAKLGAANAYHHSGDDEKAKELLNGILKDDPKNRACYEQLILIYEEEEDTIAINELISSCPVSEIYEAYKDYISMPPDFSTLGGEYSEEVELTLTALDGNSEIYYTIDGSIPDETSEKYEKPLILTEGSYIISAVCVNKKGFKSAVISEEYTVTHEAVSVPVIKPGEGKKSVPENIRASADEGLGIYYTKDGSEPTLESERYEGEIPMPMGKSTFVFAAADANGNLSESVSVTYDLQMAAPFTPADGINYLLANLVSTGKLLDTQGHAAGKNGTCRYECDSCCRSGSRIYYMITEYYDEDGKSDPTGNIYALDCATLELYRAGRDSEGNFTFEMFY